jgi:hypothetical protein
MELAAAIERLERVTATRADAAAPPPVLTAALRSTHELRSFLASAEADLARRLATASSFPEAALAEVSGESVGQAGKTLARGKTLDEAPALADALDEARITPGHIDALTRGGKGLDPGQRQRLIERVDALVDVAAASTIEQFGRRVRNEVSRIIADDGMARLERQRRQTSMSTWTDADGMWNIRGKFDPVTGLSVSSALDAAIEALFAEATPDTCPADRIEKQQHLRALAFARLAHGAAGSGRSTKPEFVAVIDVAAGSGNEPSAQPDRPEVQWPIPIEVPERVLASMVADAKLSTVVVRNGVVLHAPGELNLGRTTRLANRAQRRALNGLYRTCAVPGCTVGYDRCKLHHIVWWRNGGRTDLDNLLPVCAHHHGKIHDAGWVVDIDAQRRLTISFPDGTVRNTGPPRRAAA